MDSRKTLPKDHYAVLGISRDSTANAIKKAYRALAHKHHPDRTPSTDTAHSSSERMIEINEAFAVLSDSVRRTRLDQELAAAERVDTAAAAATAVDEEWEFPLRTSAAARPPAEVRRSNALDQSLARELLEKLRSQLRSATTAIKLQEQNVPPWIWYVEGKSWSIKYCVAAQQFQVLSPSIAREALVQAQAVIEKLRSAWKKNVLVFVLASQELQEADLIVKLFRTYCNKPENDTPKNLVNIILIDLRRRQSALCGKRSGDEQHKLILRALGIG